MINASEDVFLHHVLGSIPSVLLTCVAISPPMIKRALEGARNIRNLDDGAIAEHRSRGNPAMKRRLSNAREGTGLFLQAILTALMVPSSRLSSGVTIYAFSSTWPPLTCPSTAMAVVKG